MINNKLGKLIQIISGYQRLAIAFSGGVDSVLLLKAASLALPADQLLAVTARGPFFPKRELREAVDLASAFKLPHLTIEFNALAYENVASNPHDRCYHCKKALFQLLREQAHQRGFSTIADGGNLDDLKDYRPGAKAIEELGIISPLKLAGLNKEEVRRLSAELNLNTWDKAAFACLASRIPYGRYIEAASLERIEKAEDFLLSLGFRQVRVRAHDQLASVEVEPEERSRFFNLDFMNRVNQALKSLGFIHVTLDLGGYNSGNLNSALGENKTKEYLQEY